MSFGSATAARFCGCQTYPSRGAAPSSSPLSRGPGVQLPRCGSGTILEGIGTIPVSLNLFLEGSLVNAFLPGTLGAHATSYIVIIVSAVLSDPNGNPQVLLDGDQGFKEFDARWTSSGTIEEFTSETGFLAGTTWSGSTGAHAFHGQVTTATMDLPVGTPFEIEFELSAYAQAEIPPGDSGRVQATADFLNTFALPVNSPILNLPAGYNFVAPSLGIVDNCLGQCAPVPEPATWGLFIAGFAILGAIRRKIKR